jgi:hypothetical protein
MMNYHNLVIAPLNFIHNRKGFHCNVETLDHYIHKQAGQDIKRRISQDARKCGIGKMLLADAVCGVEY